MDSSATEPTRRPLYQALPRTSASWPELLALLGIILLADAAIYQGGGFSGIAAVSLGVPVLVLLGAGSRQPTRDVAVVTTLLIAIAVRLIWCGSPLAAVCAVILALAFAMSFSGRRPFVPEFFVFLGELNHSSYHGWAAYRQQVVDATASSSTGRPRNLLGIGLPLAAVSVFGILFLFANPDLYHRFGEEFATLIRRLRELIAGFASPSRLLFWLLVVWISVGLLRTAFPAYSDNAEDLESSGSPIPVADGLYAAWRNTLAAVTVLFAVYLAFEFQTLWLRVFPKGFYYAGYAHEGAFYLTIALGLATLILSAIFRKGMLHDARLPVLRRWAVVWAIENLLLAVAVYNRLHIYVGFNGMTRMRSVGLLGVTAVFAGCLLVVWKIIKSRNSTWLIRRQLWVLAFAIYLYAALPIDAWVTRYNVRRVLAGDPAPSVQISEHPNSVEGLLQLAPLLKTNDPIIQEGIRAMLAIELANWQSEERADWTHWQLSEEKFKAQLKSLATELNTFPSDDHRVAAWMSFKQYAFQWY